MSMYKLYATDKDLEQKGVVYEFEGFRITLARSGGANTAFTKRMEALTKPFRRAIQNETLSDKKSRSIMQQAYAETVVLNWEVEVDGVWQQGIEAPDGGVMPFTVQNVMKAFDLLPDLWADIVEISGKATGYRAHQLEEDAKN